MKKQLHTASRLLALSLALTLLLGGLRAPGGAGESRYGAEEYTITPIQQTPTVIAAVRSGSLNWGADAAHFPGYVEQYEDRFTGTVTVAVVDTGVAFDHPYLAGAVDRAKSRNFTDSSTPGDLDGHGTHIAGIIRSCLGSAADHVEIISLKALDDDGAGTDANIIKALDYAVSAGVDVVNLSLSGPHNEGGLLDKAIQSAVAKGVLVVAASGNDGTEVGDTCPAHIEVPGVLTVGSASREGERSDFSNWDVDLLAPGEEIISSVPGGGYASYSGTSMACGFVSAAGALLKLTDASLTPARLEELVKTAASSDTWEPYTGYGCLDMLEVRLPGASKPAPKDPAPEAPAAGTVKDQPWQFHSASGTYSGGWDGASPHGKGTFTFSSGQVLELTADWNHGVCATATGREKLPDGDVFEGGYLILNSVHTVSLIWYGPCKILKANGDWVESTYSMRGELLPGSSYHHADGRVIHFS